MKIVSATYGTKNVIDIINKYFNGERLHVLVGNEIFGDPNHGVLKHLVVKFDNGLEISESENNFLIYPKIKYKKIGIFYTNNTNEKTFDTIEASLKSIEIASLNKADIITCVWNHIPNNPFCEIIAKTKVSSHLNQVLQILQLLYFARLNNKNIKYVSFLEHDCLYPIEYFDYEDFETDSICNNNYIGLCENGWQKKRQDDKPLSQVTMNFEKAIKHFECILANAITTNNGSLEPWWQSQKTINANPSYLDLLKWTNSNWSCKNPAVHVNHGYHFTSHFTTFTKETTEQDFYWGNYRNFSYLFNKKSS